MIALAATHTGHEEVAQEACRHFHDIVDSCSTDELRYLSVPGAGYPSYVVRAEQWLAERG